MTLAARDETFNVRGNCTPEDVAKFIYYLDSQEAEYLNGEEIYTNGGNHLRNL